MYALRVILMMTERLGCIDGLLQAGLWERFHSDHCRGIKVDTWNQNRNHRAQRQTEVWNLQILQTNRRWYVWWMRIMGKESTSPNEGSH